jgi:hypothetical protein
MKATVWDTFKKINDKGKPKISEWNLSQGHLFHHKSHLEGPRIEPWLSQRQGSDYPPEPWHGPPLALIKPVSHVCH